MSVVTFATGLEPVSLLFVLSMKIVRPVLFAMVELALKGAAMTTPVRLVRSVILKDDAPKPVHMTMSATQSQAIRSA